MTQPSKEGMMKEINHLIQCACESYSMVEAEDAPRYINEATDRIILALQQYLLDEVVPKKKLTYEHREIKFVDTYYKETDARYNAGYNDGLAEMRERIKGIK